MYGDRENESTHAAFFCNQAQSRSTTIDVFPNFSMVAVLRMYILITIKTSYKSFYESPRS